MQKAKKKEGRKGDCRWGESKSALAPVVTKECDEINESLCDICIHPSMAYPPLSLSMLDLSMCVTGARLFAFSSSWRTNDTRTHDKAACPRNSHGVAHKRSLPQSVTPIPDLRSNLSVSAPGFTGISTLHATGRTKQTFFFSFFFLSSSTGVSLLTHSVYLHCNCYEQRSPLRVVVDGDSNVSLFFPPIF